MLNGLNNLKNLLTENIGLKLLAVVFAVILWLVVVNIDDPEKTMTFTTNVTVENENVITDMGKSYEIINDSNTTTFRVSAKRSVIEKLNGSDFKAVANMENIEMRDDGTAVVPLDITCPGYGNKVTVERKNKNLEVAIEDLRSNQFKIVAETSGTPQEGCAVGELTVFPDVLTVSGPTSVISKIAKVTATIDVEGMFSDITDKVVPVLYDANGNILDTSKVTFDVDTVKVTAEILSVKEVPISCEVSGKLDDGYQQVSVEVDPEKISLMGTAETLNNITMITIPKEALDISGAKETLTKEIDISTYLPKGVSLVDSSQAKVKVKVVIEQTESKAFNIPVGNIKVFNLSSGYSIEYQSDTIPVTLMGYTSDLEKLKASDITVSIDAGNVETGTNTLPLTLNLGGVYELYGEPTVTINVVSKKTTE